MIECDGAQHYTVEGLAADQLRDAVLMNLGLTILRFENRQIQSDIESVLMIITSHIPKNLSADVRLINMRPTSLVSLKKA